MTLKRLITLVTLLVSFGALAIPPVPPQSIQKPVKGSIPAPKDK